ncbi:MAG: glycosyltransferase, partial [Nitrososphaerota archaeon]
MNNINNLYDSRPQEWAPETSPRVVDVSIVLLNWNNAPLVADCLGSIERSGTRCSYEVIIADNNSTDGSQQWLRHLEATHPSVRCVFNPDNRGFGVGNNQAIP